MKRLIVLVFAALFAFYVAWPAFSGYQIHNALQAQDTSSLENKIDFPSVRTSMREPILAHLEKRLSSVFEGNGELLKQIVSPDLPNSQMEGLVDTALSDVVNAEGLIRIYSSGGDMGSEIQRSILKQIKNMGGFLALFKGGNATPAAGSQTAGDTDTDAESSGGFSGLKLPGAIGDLLGSDAGQAIAGKVGGDVAGAIADKLGGMDPTEIAKMLFPKLNGDPASGAGSGSSSGGSGSMSSLGILEHIKSFGFAGPLGMQMGVAKSTTATEPDVTAQINFQDLDWKVTKLTPNL